jgi:hypothetical protein
VTIRVETQLTTQLREMEKLSCDLHEKSEVFAHISKSIDPHRITSAKRAMATSLQASVLVEIANFHSAIQH